MKKSGEAKPRTMNKYQDEISIGDVLALLVARRRLAVVCFIIPVLLATAYALLRQENYEYRSVYQLAEGYLEDGEATVAPLETGESVISKATSLFLPQAINALSSEKSQPFSDFSLELSSPEDTKLVTIATVEGQAQKENVQLLHEELLSRIAESQDETFEEVESRLMSRLSSADSNYQSLKDSESRNAAELATRYIELMADYDNRLMALQKGEVLSVAERSSEPVGMGDVMWVLAGIMLGFVAALLGPLLAEGVALMNRAYRRERTA